MSKSKDLKYVAEWQRRMKLRKEERLVKFTKNREFRQRSTRSGCRGCGEDPYCYCGEEGIPYSY